MKKGIETKELGAEEQFNTFRNAMESANGEIITKIEGKPKRPWMKEEILNLMDERRT